MRLQRPFGGVRTTKVLPGTPAAGGDDEAPNKVTQDRYVLFLSFSFRLSSSSMGYKISKLLAVVTSKTMH